MRSLLAAGLVVGVAVSALAQSPIFFFHHSASPVAVPCGPTTFFLDENAPGAAVPSVEDRTIARGETQSFPEFTSLAFGRTRPSARSVRSP